MMGQPLMRPVDAITKETNLIDELFVNAMALRAIARMSNENGGDKNYSKAMLSCVAVMDKARSELSKTPDKGEGYESDKAG